jgi:hypothetical protein
MGNKIHGSSEEGCKIPNKMKISGMEEGDILRIMQKERSHLPSE